MGSAATYLLFGITRLRATFVDDIGNEKPVCGTGFYLESKVGGGTGHISFVTNKHLVDPRMTLGANWRTSRIDLCLRELHANPKPPPKMIVTSVVHWYEVTNLSTALFADDAEGAADCAIIVQPTYANRDAKHIAPTILDEIQLCTEQELGEAFSLGDQVSFVGFPGEGKDAWWDTSWNVPISRPAWLASFPGFQYSNEKKLTTGDALLVTGLSFSGSSGSPVVAHPESLETMRILGIMSGHYDDGSWHSGLSHLTRSTAIRALLNVARAAGFRTAAPYSGLWVPPPPEGTE